MKAFIPALRWHFATGLYDAVVPWTTRERTVKAALVEKLSPRAGERILDVGCGTGTLAIAVARAQPAAVVRGVDADRAILARATAKSTLAGIDIGFTLGFAQHLPFADRSFDAVVSSLFFHHLTREGKSSALAEIARVLRPGGRLLIADWGRPSGPVARMLFLVVQFLDGFESTRDSVDGALPELMASAGFGEISVIREFATPLGTIALYAGGRCGDWVSMASALPSEIAGTSRQGKPKSSWPLR